MGVESPKLGVEEAGADVAHVKLRGAFRARRERVGGVLDAGLVARGSLFQHVSARHGVDTGVRDVLQHHARLADLLRRVHAVE